MCENDNGREGGRAARMRILLLQPAIYLPSLGGGNKANRFLLEALAKRGHECAAVCPAHNQSGSPAQFLSEMRERGVEVDARPHGAHTFNFRGVRVEAYDPADSDGARALVGRRIEEFRPDWVLVSDDRHRFLLSSALRAAPDRVVYLVHTTWHLPFGPHATGHESREQTRLIARARARITVSRHTQEYLRLHAGLDSTPMHFPVYGEGPFPVLARFDRGCVTMINPCVPKGLPVFLELARLFPRQEFAAVPTWGADASDLRELAGQPNVRLLKPVDDIEEVLAQTKVLVAPSLVAETFGYVAPEAMLRGIPVLASDIGGLREAKLGVDYLLPVRPAVRDGGGAYVSPPQDVRPWASALDGLLEDAALYGRCSAASRAAALRFAASVRASHFEDYLRGLDA